MGWAEEELEPTVRERAWTQWGTGTRWAPQRVPGTSTKSTERVMCGQRLSLCPCAAVLLIVAFHEGTLPRPAGRSGCRGIAVLMKDGLASEKRFKAVLIFLFGPN